MIDSMMKILIFLIGLYMLIFVFWLIIHFFLILSVISSEADQDPEDKFEVREDWREFM